MKPDYGLLGLIPDNDINRDPRHNDNVMHMLDEVWHKCLPSRRDDLRASTPWFYNNYERGGQLELPLWKQDLLP